MTIAIGENKKVSLWCEVRRRHKNGRIDFYVINGAWEGHIQNGMVHVDATKHKAPGEILWEGEVPTHLSYDYNEAIPWIQEQLK